MRALPSYRLRAVHVTAAWAFAVSQPIFSLLLANPEFLVVRGATRGEVVAFALCLALVPPLAAVLCLKLVALLSTNVADVLYLGLLGTLAAAFGAQILKKLGWESSAILFVAVAAASALVFAYVRWGPVRLLLTSAVCLPAFGVLAFVARAPIVTEDLAGADVRVAQETPIVFVLLDELPVSSLMTPSGELDALRYPSFARLARDGTWYRRATTVHESTTGAVPAILTGRLPKPGGLPTLRDHPDNLFTLLGESYSLAVSEHVTYLCPKRYCPREREPFLERMSGLFADVEVAFLHLALPERIANSLPRVDDRWGGFSKERILAASDSRELFDAATDRPPPTEFAAFTEGIGRDEPGRSLHFAHLMLPHSPWRFLPSGRDLGEAGGDVGLGEGLEWEDEPWLVRQAYRRHLLQVGYTDSLLGRLLRRLEELVLYDRSLVIVAADHGISFVAGREAREGNPENLADVAAVPLFVKYPGQRDGRIDDRAVRTIDILPTIADVLDVRVPWSVDGQSLLGTWRERTNVSVLEVGGALVEAPVGEVRRLLQATLRRKAAFGPTWESLSHADLRPPLRGVDLGSLGVSDADGARVTFDGEEASTDAASQAYVPAWITGTIEGVEISRRQELAIAVNGRIVAPARAVPTDGTWWFSALVPEAAFREGTYRVELLAVDGHGSGLRLTRLGATG